MDEQQIKEVGQIIVEAGGGNWIPAAVVGSLMSVIVILLLYIYSRDRRSSDRRHKEAEATQEKLTESNELLRRMLAVHDVKIQKNEQDIARIIN